MKYRSQEIEPKPVNPDEMAEDVEYVRPVESGDPDYSEDEERVVVRRPDGLEIYAPRDKLEGIEDEEKTYKERERAKAAAEKKSKKDDD